MRPKCVLSALLLLLQRSTIYPTPYSSQVYVCKCVYICIYMIIILCIFCIYSTCMVFIYVAFMDLRKHLIYWRSWKPLFTLCSYHNHFSFFVWVKTTQTICEEEKKKKSIQINSLCVASPTHRTPTHRCDRVIQLMFFDILSWNEAPERKYTFGLKRIYLTMQNHVKNHVVVVATTSD